MKMVIILFLLVYIIGCDRITAPGGKNEPEEIAVKITGTVFDDSTNAPIDSSSVYILEIYCRNFNDCGDKIVTTTISDSQGFYTLIANIQKVKYTYYVGASKSGYIRIAGYSGNKIPVAFVESQRIDIRLKKCD